MRFPSALPGALAALALAARAAPTSAESNLQQAAPAKPGFRLDGLHKTDLLHGSAPVGDAAIDLLHWALTIDGGAWLGWNGIPLHIEALATHGGKPDRRLDTLGRIGNLEVAQNSVRDSAGGRPAEVALAAGERGRLGSHGSLQPLVQQVWNPGARAGRATVAGLHVEGALQPAPP